MGSARRAWLDFKWRRFRGFLKQFSRSRRAVIGVFILVFYVSFALVAPFLTRYDPINSEFLSGEFARPTWWSSLSGGSHLSQNTQLLDNTGFRSPSSITDQGWNVVLRPSPSLSFQYNATQSIAFPGTPIVFPGSEEFAYSRTAGSPIPLAPGGMITISKTFTWPYQGPPKRFLASLELLLGEIKGVSSVNVNVFISKEGTPLEIYETTLDNNSVNKALIPTFQLDSYSSGMLALFNGVDPASFIFFEKGTYSYGVQIVIPDTDQASNVSVKLFFNGLNLRMLGTSFGLLGTDQYGRDIFTQLAWGTRVSLIVGLVASILAIAVGLAVGLIAGYMGKIVDEVLMRTTDLLLVLPVLPLLIVLAALFGSSIWNVIGILALLGWPGFARVIRSQVLSLKERSFIEASKAAGSGVFHVITKHVVPNVMGLTYVNLALAVPAAIVAEAALSFLGLADPSVISWGKMLNDVQGTGHTADWWWVLPPGLSIAALSLSFVLLGYALDELLNPKLRMRR